LEEIFLNFSIRTQIRFIRDANEKPIKAEGNAYQYNVPQTIADLIIALTGGHVGYVSAILHILNANFANLPDETSLLKYMRSSSFYTPHLGKRPATNISKLDDETKEALKSIWQKQIDMLISNSHYEMLVRMGYIALDENQVSLFCPLSKQLLLMSFTSSIMRPLEDSYEDLSSFLSRGVGGAVLEAQ
jgi:hypothetical protein